MTQPSVFQTCFNYYLELADGGVDAIYSGTAGDKNRKHNPQPWSIIDIRGHENDFTVDANGFQLVKHESHEKLFDDDERVRREVYSETSELLKAATKATYVRPFSHLIRRDTWQAALDAARGRNDLDIVKVQNSAMWVHIDQSYNGAAIVLEDNLEPAAVEHLSKHRWGIINVWRPIKRVLREPLGVCDARTVSESDLRPVKAHLPPPSAGNALSGISRGRVQETWGVAANPSHRWYFASQMTPDEVLLIKCYDSKEDGRARRTPHSAFKTDLDEGPARESIEVRCLVFWEDQEVS